MAASNLATIADLDDILADLDLTGSAQAAAPVPVTPLAVVASVPAPVASAVLPTELEEFYGSVDKAQAEELRAVAARIKERDRMARAAIIEIGNDLIAIKNSMPGHFDRWLKLEFDLSKATAWNYINAAERFGDVPKVVEILPPATVYKLAAKATPQNLRDAVVLEITSGTVPTKQDVERRIAIARNEAAEAEREGRERAEAERQKQEDEKVWHARAKELADAGKAEAEIEKERRAWDTAKARKERQKQKRWAVRQEREAEERRAWDAREAEWERQRQTGRKVADLLREALGDRFEAFRSLMADADVHEFKNAVLEHARPAGEVA